MHRYLSFFVWSTLAILTFHVSGAEAALVLCADSIAGIEFSLAVAEDNGQDDDIRLVSGTYSLNAPLSFTSFEGRGLSISGGWNANCSAQTNSATVLDGQGKLKQLTIYQSTYSSLATVRVQGITFSDGLAVVGSYGGALWIHGPSSVVIDLNRFYFNRAEDGAGAVYLSSKGSIYLRNNLFFGNRANHDAGAWLDSISPVYIVSNTFVANTSDTAQDAGALYVLVNATTRVAVSDNILWNNNANGAADMRIENAHALLYNNDIGTWAGSSAALGSGANLSVDPHFASCGGFICFNFDLAANSPLLNAGRDSPPGGLTSTDLSRGPRIVGAHVDIGAYERDAIN